ncbi:MAG: ATP-binding cassette domain-containing protein [Planctomycetota bacterium]|jgi:ABC-type ATPase with predicted acetyltransferase domain
MASCSLKQKWLLRVNAKIHRVIPPHADAGRVAAMFGLQNSLTETLYEGFELAVREGQIVAVAGPSGAGKSVLLREIAAQVPDAIVMPVNSPARSLQPAVAVLRGGPLRERLGVLARCGLAEATALVTPARNLSGGQRYRLALAAALHRAKRRNKATMVIADEFAATLDSVTASVLSRQIRKLVASSPIALVTSTPRTELLVDLQCDQVLVKPIREPVRVSSPQKDAFRDKDSVFTPGSWKIRVGTIADYDALSSFHYLSGRPAAHKRVYVIRTPKSVVVRGAPELAAVLVVSPPLANVRGRNILTGGRYAGPDRAAAMTLLNAEVECISRVVVHPIFRGSRLAVRLVRHAIAAGETVWTEALAAMGEVHPFFEKAGMTALALSADRGIARFLSAAEAVGLRARQVLAVEPVRKLLRRKRSRPARFLQKELDLAVERVFSTAELPRLADPVAELCRRTARRYVYYLARTPKEYSQCPHPRSTTRNLRCAASRSMTSSRAGRTPTKSHPELTER